MKDIWSLNQQWFCGDKYKKSYKISYKKIDGIENNIFLNNTSGHLNRLCPEVNTRWELLEHIIYCTVI